MPARNAKGQFVKGSGAGVSSGGGTKNAKGNNWTWKGGDLTKKLHKGMVRNMNAAANKVKNNIVMSFIGTGDTNSISGGGGAPAPAGGPPGVQTGHLKGSINFEVKQRGPLKITGTVGTGIGNADSTGYAVYLEYGTMNMPARPFLRPRLTKDKAMIARTLGRKIF